MPLYLFPVLLLSTTASANDLKQLADAVPFSTEKGGT